MNNPYRVHGETILLEIKAVPGASKTEIAGVCGGKLRVRIAAAPEDGKANKELLGFLAKILDCPKRDIVLTGGKTSRIKTVVLQRKCEEKLALLLARDLH